MKLIGILFLIASAGLAFAQEKVFTEEDLSGYKDTAPMTQSAPSSGSAASSSADREYQTRKEREEKNKQLSDCLQNHDTQRQYAWDRLCRNDNLPPGCLLARYKRQELDRQRDNGKADCYRQYR